MILINCVDKVFPYGSINNESEKTLLMQYVDISVYKNNLGHENLQ